MNPALPVAPYQRPGALSLVWLVRAVSGMLVALPVASALSAPLAEFPEGDRLLFAPGATYLIEVLRLSLTHVGAAARSSGWLFVAFGFLQLVPLAALLSALSLPRRLSVGELLAHGARHLPSFSVLGGVTVLVQSLLLVTLGLPTLLLGVGLRSSFEGAGADLTALGGVAALLLLVGLLGAIQDLARAAVVRHDLGVRAALTVGIRAFIAHPLPVTFAWLWRALAASLLFVSAGAVGLALGPGGPGVGRLVAQIAIHEIAILGAVYLRAEWLRYALTRVSCPSPQSPACTAERSVSQADPSPDPDASPADAAPPSPDDDAPPVRAEHLPSTPRE